MRSLLLKTIPSFVIVTLCVGATIVQPACATPVGAVKVSAQSYFKAGSFYCALIKHHWIAGRLLPRGFFYSRTAERANVLRQASSKRGKARTKLLRQAAALFSEVRVQNNQCEIDALIPPTPAPTATPSGMQPTPNATPHSTPTTTPTPTPSITLRMASSNLYYTEHALFIIPAAGQVTWTGASSYDSVYSTANIDSYVASLKSVFPSDYFFVVVTASNLLPDHAPNVLLHRQNASGIGEDSITGTNVPNICRYHSDGTVIDGIYGVLDHEIGHNWGVFLGSQLGTPHWLPNSTVNGQMADIYSDDAYATSKQIHGNPTDGFTWTSSSGVDRNNSDTFTENDLYLQGLAATFPAVHVFSSPVYNNDHTVSYASVSSYDQAWVESNFGVRNPSYRTSPKRFRVGFVYVARDLSEISNAYAPIERSINEFINGEQIDTVKYPFTAPYLVDTKFRASLDALLTDIDGNATPAISIVGASYATASAGAATFSFTATDADGPAPSVSCIPSSSHCAVSASSVTVSGLTTGSYFYTLKAQDSAGKRSFTHFVVDVP